MSITRASAHGLLSKYARLEALRNASRTHRTEFGAGRAKLEQLERPKDLRDRAPVDAQTDPLTPDRREILLPQPAACPRPAPEAKAELLPVLASGDGLFLSVAMTGGS
jgi:hypothetical protein